MLIEVLRKVWYTFTIKKIWAHLEQHKLLEDNQWGSRRGKDISLCMISMINTLEEVMECEAAIVISSVDLIHAFDCVSKNGNKISMMSKGMDLENAKFIGDFDEKGKTIIRTPKAHEWWVRHIGNCPTNVSFTDTDGKIVEPEVIQPKRGLSQGGEDAPCKFVMYMDIGLAAQKADPQREVLYFRGLDDIMYEASDSAYVDDKWLLSVTIPGMERKLNLESSITDVLGMEISIPKLRQVAVEYRDKGIHSATNTIMMKLKQGNQMITIPEQNNIKQLGYIKSLGKDNLGDDAEQFRELKATLTLVCDIIGKKGSTTDCKLMSLFLGVYPMVLYRAQLAPWSLEQCRELDVPVTKLLKKITKNMTSYPNRLLYVG